VTRLALHVLFSSTAGSTRRISPMSQTSSPKKMRPCVPSWCAGTSLSTVACLPVTESSKASLLRTRTGVERVATLLPGTVTVTADDLETTPAAVRPLHLSNAFRANMPICIKVNHLDLESSGNGAAHMETGPGRQGAAQAQDLQAVERLHSDPKGYTHTTSSATPSRDQGGGEVFFSLTLTKRMAAYVFLIVVSFFSVFFFISTIYDLTTT
jgi:hypothetical protein